MKLKELQNEINKLATRAVLEGEGSHSCHENLATGPKYQKIEVATNGYDAFRDDTRLRYIKAIDHTNARVLDIGCNMGVTTRLFSTLGAREAIGLEYDPYFITIGRLVNASLQLENVRFVHGDATDPDTYWGIPGRFDITYCLSAFNYAQHAMEAISALTEQLFIVETHRALPGTFRKYYAIISKYFPAYKILGFTDHGKNTNDKRLFIVFARGENEIADFPSYDDEYRKEKLHLDLENTKFSYLNAFFAVHEVGKPFSKKVNDASSGIIGVTYWEKLIEGYDHWLQRGKWQKNPYYLYLLQAQHNKWPGGAILNTRVDHKYILDRRYQTFKRAYEDKEPEYPLKIRVQASKKGGTHVFTNGERYTIAENDGIEPGFDGIHRCFMYKFAGWKSLPANVTFVP